MNGWLAAFAFVAVLSWGCTFFLLLADLVTAVRALVPPCRRHLVQRRA